MLAIIILIFACMDTFVMHFYDTFHWNMQGLWTVLLLFVINFFEISLFF